MPSNLPPPMGEEVVLRARRQALYHELGVVRANITQSQNMVASVYRTIDVLAQSCVSARATFHEHQQPGSSPSKPAEICDDPIAQSLGRALPLCVAPSPEVLETAVFSLDDELRRQRLILNVNSTSLKLYTLTETDILKVLKDIKDAFSAIKRAPDDIWYEILSVRIAGDRYRWPEDTDKHLVLVALPYSHVCRTWRRVVISSPSMWKSLHWNLPPNVDANHNLLDLWLRRSKNIHLEVWESQMYSEIATAGAVCKRLKLPTPKTLQYMLHQTTISAPYSMHTDTDSEIDFRYLVLRAWAPTRMPELQETLILRFTSLESLCMDNVVPWKMPRIPTLRHLRVFFDAFHGSYPLGEMLSRLPNLQTLKLVHHHQYGLPRLRECIELPNLWDLSVTPLEGALLDSLILPSLRLLSISNIRNRDVVVGGAWLNALTPHCTNLTSLTLSCNGEDAQHALFDRLHILSTIRSRAPKLRKVTISDGHLLGTALADSLEVDERYSRIDCLTIDGCIGVSRMDCERIVLLVNKLDVYRTVHGASKSA